MKTIIQYEGQKTTIQGKSSPKEAMEICGLNPKEWKVASKEVTDKAVLYTLERIRSLAVVLVEKQATEEHPAVVKAADDIPDEVDQHANSIITPTPMEFTLTIPRDELQAVLQVIVEIVPKQGMLPALSMVKIVSGGDDITLTATDLERSFSVSIPAIGNQAAFLVDASLLAREIRALHKEIEDIVLTAVDNMVRINDRCLLPIGDVEEFPVIPSITDEAVSLSNLAKALCCVLPAVSTDPTRYALTNIYFDFPRGNIVGTDGVRLHRAHIRSVDLPACLVPYPAASMLHKYQATELVLAEKHLSASLMGGTMTTRLTEGTFPDYAGIIDDIKNEHTAMFLADEFLALVPGILPVSESAAIDMTMNGRIDIKSESSAGSYQWHVPADVNLSSGMTKTIRINCRFLMDAIKAYAESNSITMTFPETYGAITINEKAVIMPMRA